MECPLQVVAVPACLAAVRAVAPPELSPGSPYEEKMSKCERKESLDSMISNSTPLRKVGDSFHPTYEFHLLTNVPLGSLTTSRTLSTTPTWEEIQLVRLDGEVFHLQERKNSGKWKPDSLDGDHGEERAEAFKEGGLPARERAAFAPPGIGQGTRKS